MLILYIVRPLFKILKHQNHVQRQARGYPGQVHLLLNKKGLFNHGKLSKVNDDLHVLVSVAR